MICKALPNFRYYSIQDFSVAMMLTSSRIFGFKIRGKKTSGFVPYADMLNHRQPRQTRWYYNNQNESKPENKRPNGFNIEAVEDITRGQEVFTSYGTKCNSRFFLNYGFVNLVNDANEVHITANMDPRDIYFDVKR